MILGANATSDSLRPASHAARMEHGAPSVTNRDVSSKLDEEGSCLVRSFLSQPRSCLQRILPPLPWMHLRNHLVTPLLAPSPLFVGRRLLRCIVAALSENIAHFLIFGCAFVLQQIGRAKNLTTVPHAAMRVLHSHAIFGTHPRRLRQNSSIGHSLRNIF